MKKASLRIMQGHRNLIAALKIRNENPRVKIVENDPPGFILIESEESIYVRRAFFESGNRSFSDSTWESVLLNKHGDVINWDDNSFILEPIE